VDELLNSDSGDPRIKLVAEAVSRLGKTIDETPTIVMVGAVGNGKTTTVKKLFNMNSVQVIEEFGIQDFRTGTTKDKAYDMELKGVKLRLIDLPGLGDSPKEDEKYKEAYRRCLKEAHAIVFVVVPPRPAAAGTCITLDLILECGFPADAIVFGINKLYELRDGSGQEIRIDSAYGPNDDGHADRVERARIEFLEQINEHSGMATFVESQVVAYDAANGWNSFRLIEEAVKHVPWRALRRWRQATSEAEARQEEAARENKALTARLEEYKKGITYRTLEGMAKACRENGWKGLADGIDGVKDKIARTTHAIANAAKAVFDLIFG
jgi:uncharacterized protein